MISSKSRMHLIWSVKHWSPEFRPSKTSSAYLKKSNKIWGTRMMMFWREWGTMRQRNRKGMKTFCIWIEIWSQKGLTLKIWALSSRVSKLNWHNSCNKDWRLKSPCSKVVALCVSYRFKWGRKIFKSRVVSERIKPWKAQFKFWNLRTMNWPLILILPRICIASQSKTK